MAKNLRAKLPKDDTLYVHDIDTNSSAKFLQESGANGVVVAKSAREVAEESVSCFSCLNISATTKMSMFYL